MYSCVCLYMVGASAAASDPYGGIVFAYSNTTVRLWSPSVSNDGTLGFSIVAGNPVRVEEGRGEGGSRVCCRVPRCVCTIR